MNIILVILYIAVAIFTYGFMRGTVTKRFPKLDFNSFDNLMSCFISTVWPLGLPIFTLVWSDRSTKYWCIRFRK